MKNEQKISVEATLVNKETFSYNAVEGLEDALDQFQLDFIAEGKPREFYSLQKHKPLFLKMSHIISISFSSGYLFAFFSPLS